MKNDRLFQLLYLLLEKGSMTSQELAARLEVSVRTVYRYVEALSAAGVPVYASQGRGGGISLTPGYTVDKAMLSEREQDELLFAVQSLSAANLDTEPLLNKIGAAFQRTAHRWIEVDFSRWGTLRHEDNLRFEKLRGAVMQKQVVILTYCGVSGNITKRVVHPIRLIYKDKNWYLQAFCLKAKGFRSFRLPRITDIELTGETFGEDYWEQLPQLEPEPQSIPASIHLRLAIANQQAFRVYEEFEHNKVQPQPDGSFVVEVDFPLDDWVTGYIFSFGTAIEVLEPLEFRDVLAQYAFKIAEHHKR